MARRPGGFLHVGVGRSAVNTFGCAAFGETEGVRHNADGDEEVAGTLEIEFEDDAGSPEPATPPGSRPRDLRPGALIALAVAILAAILAATHNTGTHSTNGADNPAVAAAVPNFGAFVVTVEYRGAHVLSLPQRLIEVDLRVVPLPGARVTILNYYVDENGIVSTAIQAPSSTPLPASGADYQMDLLVHDCTVVPIDESMSSVDVVADGPAGIIDRFTILGHQYSANLARLLRTVCPGRADDQNPLMVPGRVTGP